MARKQNEVPPALRNEDVTGITEDKQDEIAAETGTGPRSEAAESFVDEQREQAQSTESSSQRSEETRGRS